MKRSARALAGALVVMFSLSGCKEETKVNIASTLHPEKMPTMMTKNVSTLISDSGIVQYKILAPLWKVYDEVDTPYWKFPEGLYLQKYDRNHKVIATVAADSATYFKNEKLWRLDGHVEMKKMPRDIFLSERVFWDQKRAKIYSDTFIHIENENHVLEGDGFISNERLTVYRVLKPKGIFPVKKEDVTGAGGGAVPSAGPQNIPAQPPSATGLAGKDMPLGDAG